MEDSDFDFDSDSDSDSSFFSIFTICGGGFDCSSSFCFALSASRFISSSLILFCASSTFR